MTTPKSSAHGSKSASKSAPPPAPAAPFKRRDASGHLDPEYAKGLLEKSGHHAGDGGHHDNNDKAFLKHARSKDELTEGLGEQFVGAITSGEEQGEEALDALNPEESGGPFIVTRGKTEFADDIDASNPGRRDPRAVPDDVNRRPSATSPERRARRGPPRRIRSGGSSPWSRMVSWNCLALNRVAEGFSSASLRSPRRRTSP